MLHEILLSLSGYHSEIWETVKTGSADDGKHGLHAYVSEPERAMLAVLADISRLHIEIKEAAARIAASHASVICRAVASTISDQQLARFRKKVLDVESSILRKDAAYVGAYEIVPLSTIVGEFSPWSRRLDWLNNVVKYMEDPKRLCSGKAILDYLQDQTHTGYADIEEMASCLLVSGQRVWMRLLASWVLYGKLPSFGAKDFMVRPNKSSLSQIDQYVLEALACPAFLSNRAAEAVLSIGSALNQIESHGQHSSLTIPSSTSQTLPLLARHLALLESLAYPLAAPILEATLATIDQSISQNALSSLLPLDQIIAMLRVIHRFVLLGSGEFAVALIEHGAEKMANKQDQSTKPVRKVGRIDHLVVKGAELGVILNKTWGELAAFQFDQGLDDETFVLARRTLLLRGLEKSDDAESQVSTWLPQPAFLDLNLPRDSALRLFLTSDALRSYSAINAYLLSVRRGELQLANLWKVTAERRCYPTPIGPPNSATRMGRQALATRRAREDSRSTVMRQHWATASKALFLINEFSGYLHGEVIRNSWECFDVWLREGKNSSRPGSSRSQPSRPTTGSSMKQSIGPDGSVRARDPRSLTLGHNAFLVALHAGLLLTHDQFVKAIKEFLNLIDHYVALFHRLQVIWEGLDLQEDEGVVDAFSNYAQDEKLVLGEMSRSRGLLEDAVTGIVTKLKEAEKDRVLDEIASNVAQLDLERQKFVPWKSRTMDRLIMKLDFLAGAVTTAGKDDLVDGFDDQ
jgi:hypothetical protein